MAVSFHSWRNTLFLRVNQQPSVSNWQLPLMGFEPQRRGASSFKARRFNHSATEAPTETSTPVLLLWMLSILELAYKNSSMAHNLFANTIWDCEINREIHVLVPIQITQKYMSCTGGWVTKWIESSPQSREIAASSHKGVIIVIGCFLVRRSALRA